MYCRNALKKVAIFALAAFVCVPSLSAIAEPPLTGSIVFPILNPRLSSTFGSRTHPVKKTRRHHNGIDLAAPSNSHVRAISSGRVVFADTYAGYGKLVTISHKDGYVSMYGHLSEIRVNVGQVVEAGDLIGRVGETGLATGPHLHFEWRKDGKPINPLKAFPFLTAEAEG